jgi:predicted Zn finger-like uncharacterized protein
VRIECPGCQAEYQLNEKKIPAMGATVLCRKCKARISVKPPSEKVENKGPDQTSAKPTPSVKINLDGQASRFRNNAAKYCGKIRMKATTPAPKSKRKKSRPIG